MFEVTLMHRPVTVDHIWPSVAELVPMLVEFCTKLTSSIGSNLTRIRPMCTKPRPKLANMKQHWPKTRATATQNWRSMARCGPCQHFVRHLPRLLSLDRPVQRCTEILRSKNACLRVFPEVFDFQACSEIMLLRTGIARLSASACQSPSRESILRSADVSAANLPTGESDAG